MKNKYISFFKKELIFLLILLIVVCISFGITYANFVYNYEDKRAVEMFAGALSYNLKINGIYQNNIDLVPGSSIINLEIESTNEISTYYKLLINKNITIYSIDGLTKGVIGSNDKLNVRLYVVNTSSENVNISFVVSMGYLTNTLDDVIINTGYYEIEKLKDEITYNNKKWNILRINDNASIDLIEKNVSSVTINGYNGYNNLVDLLNSKCINARSISVSDIDGLDINIDNDFVDFNKLVYFPNSLVNDENVILNHESTEMNGYSYSNGIMIRNKSITSNINNDLFKNNKYLLSTPYYEMDNNEIYYYAIELNNGVVNLRKLYNSDNTNYEITSNVRCITNISGVAF